jgi:hypothetical protein
MGSNGCYDSALVHNHGNGSAGALIGSCGRNENLRSKWIYVKDNPVRHGLVHKAEDWAYYLDFMNEADRGSCQLPLQGDRVQFRGIGG